MRRLLLIPALSAALLLAACDGPAEFAAPLTQPGTAPYDEGLIGSWYSLAPHSDGVAMLVIEPGEEGDLDTAFGYMSVAPGEQGLTGIAWTNHTVHASVIGGQTYYNTRVTDGGMIEKQMGQPLDTKIDPIFAPHPGHGYWIVRTELSSDGILTVQILAETRPNALGLPSHEVDCGKDCKFGVYDLGPAELAALIGSEPDEQLFSIRLPFARFGAPPPPQPK